MVDGDVDPDICDSFIEFNNFVDVDVAPDVCDGFDVNKDLIDVVLAFVTDLQMVMIALPM